MDTLSGLVAEMHRLINAANERQIQLRAFGGLAILKHSHEDPRFFRRDAPDIDLISLNPFFGAWVIPLTSSSIY
jgi:hypothetical protein